MIVRQVAAIEISNSAYDALKDAMGIFGLVIDGDNTNVRALPRIVVSNLSDSHIVLRAQKIDQTLKDAALVLQRAAVRDMKINLKKSEVHQTAPSMLPRQILLEAF